MTTFYPLSVAEVLPQTRSAVTVKFAIPQELRATFRIRPGQYIKLKTRIKDQEAERFYSVCDYGSDYVQVGIKRVSEGLFSNYACDHIQAGDVIEVMPPQGDFCLPSAAEMAAAKQYLFVAAGSGITPILAMIRQLLHHHQDTQITLIYVNPQQKDIMFFDVLEALKNQYMQRFSLVHVLTREPRDLPLLSKRPEGEGISQLLSAFVDTQHLDHAYLCGPLSLIEGFREALLSKGLAKKAVHMELFGNNSPSAARKIEHNSADSIITIITKGREQKVAVAQGQNILDAAIEAGADVPFACKGGVCATCKAKMVEGSAEMLINYGLEEDEVARGYTLTCQAHLTSATAVVDFDV